MLKGKWWPAGLLYILGLGLVITGALGLASGYAFSPAATGLQEGRIVVVSENATAGQVAEMLAREKLIRSRWAFEVYTRLHGNDRSLKAGTYSFSANQSLPEIVRMLVSGRTVMVTFTIPEGFTISQIADVLEQHRLIDRQEFFEVVAKEDFPYPFLEGLPSSYRRLEGYLYPDTYRVPCDIDEKQLVDIMLARFQREITNLNYEERARKIGLSLHDAVTIASLVEREAKLDSERPVISGIIQNRLRRQMPLQIDATVVYALGRQPNRGVVTYQDLTVDSPYNTYLYTGLPPGPIASPGRKSLLAAVSPAATPYLYYVAKPDGSHAFACTLDEHNRYKRQYQR
ncbi:MAG: endolytic transglycosylase MltG [Desulfotomaculales bacterium]